ncbi:hypothetical protein FQN60_010532 [Etheostoma spectabile]|uniref:Uncharacterized protein n=1 Tax=Etheostoma spectabile TaxID=54343 RepID=A0A5J5D555_9PERO|nr:hypothetical protein FQN60_010532 [Etheostoma spectabile]
MAVLSNITKQTVLYIYTCRHLLSVSAGELITVHPVQNLLGRGPLSLLPHAHGRGSRQDQDQPFEGRAQPGDTHVVGKVEESIRPGVAVVNLIEWLADTSRLTQRTQERHRGRGVRWRCQGPLEGGAGRRGGSGSSHCSAESQRGGLRAGQARRRAQGLRGQDVARRLHRGRHEALGKFVLLVRARLCGRLPFD